MRSRLLTLGVASAALVLGGRAAAQDSKSTPSSTSSTSTSGTTASRTSTSSLRTGKGTLPDPALLDGSALPAEKKSDHGMLGEFEIPGDENAPKDGKVGTQQQQQGGGGGGQQQQQQTAMTNGMPAGGASGGQQNQQNQQGGGGGQQGQQGGGGSQQANAQNGQQGGGGGPQGQQGQGGSAGAIQGDPNGQAIGTQVAELKGDGSGANGGASGGNGTGNVDKPKQVALGDSAMQIKPVTNAAQIVGVASAGNTQQMEKPVGQGGGGSSGNSQSGGPNRAEKGRTMPAGL